MSINECPICYEEMDESNSIITNCNHKYHKDCLNVWANKHNSCPEKSYWSAGLHPHEADSLEDIKNELQALMEEADLIGETGLDYYRNLSSKENSKLMKSHTISISTNKSYSI